MQTKSSYDFYSSMEFYHNRARELRAEATRDFFTSLGNLPKRLAGKR